jgi:hypothetical protein
MGGMGGMGGMMGGGMRSVPPTGLPFADLRPGQTRHLPTRLVSLNSPDPQSDSDLPGKGEPLQVLGDIAQVNHQPRVQKALERLAAGKAPTSVSQLVMWRLVANLDWDTMVQLSERWANPFELTLARDFVEHLDTLSEGETGRLLCQVEATDAASRSLAVELSKAMQGQTVLGLLAESGIPERPAGPAVSFHVRLTASEALVRVSSSDPTARGWIPFGKFSLPLARDSGTVDARQFADALAEGILHRLVRAQLIKGLSEKGRRTYQLRIDNASPLILNGLAVLGTASRADQAPKVWSGISIPPRRCMTLQASEEVVKTLGLKKGIRVVAIDLSGL